MSEWPVPYISPSDTSNAATKSPPNPGWQQRAPVLQVGRALAIAMISNPQLADDYRGYALLGKGSDQEEFPKFVELLKQIYPADYTNFNQNDFANTHHVAWILIGRALASLTNLNPHGDWGEPPVNGSVHHEDETLVADSDLLVAPVKFVPYYYHFVPNATGYYAIGTSDAGMGAPNTGV